MIGKTGHRGFLFGKVERAVRRVLRGQNPEGGVVCAGV
jgi:hypothetical protein